MKKEEIEVTLEDMMSELSKEIVGLCTYCGYPVTKGNEGSEALNHEKGNCPNQKE